MQFCFHQACASTEVKNLMVWQSSYGVALLWRSLYPSVPSMGTRLGMPSPLRSDDSS